MKKIHTILLTALVLCGCINPKSDNLNVITYCNPLDLSYRFQPDNPSRREAADPTVVLFKDKYFLFASKSGVYWYSNDLAEWSFIATDQIPTEEYAPTAIEIEDTIYFLASSHKKSTIYKTSDPLSGHWTVALDSLQIPVWDPAFYLDDDHRLYLYWGCSDKLPIYGVELDYKNKFAFIGEPVALIYANKDAYGWEVPGDNNQLLQQAPWIEGAWMNKYNGTYYLQYAGPGTEYKSYCDAVYVSQKPLGPFKLADHNPFAYKPSGFTSGAGHGSTFKDKYGNYWHMGTVTISQLHKFERRVSLHPLFFDTEGAMYSITKFGDYPLTIPQKKSTKFEDFFPEWMLLSYNKPTNVSSTVDSLLPAAVTDEDIRTWWSATTGNPGEFVIVDMNNLVDVYAVQINFADQETQLYARESNKNYRYILESSKDQKDWKNLADRSENMSDNSHNYIQLPAKVKCRYIKLTNVSVPSGKFAVSGLRVFGNGNGEKPSRVKNLMCKRNNSDRRNALISWSKSEDATGYHINYGTSKEKLYNHWIVYKDTSLIINSLNTEHTYYFAVEAFNENGIAPASDVIEQ